MSPASYQTAPPRDVCCTCGLLIPADCIFQRTAYSRAGNGTRTRDPNLGKVVLYQLSYSRDCRSPSGQAPATGLLLSAGHGGEGNRTPDLLNAIQALSQLSYAPSNLLRVSRRWSWNPNRQEPRSLVRGTQSVKKPGLAESRSASILQRFR